MGRVRPILFNTEMTEAVLKERKTATRRIIKPQPKDSQQYRLGICTCGENKNVGRFAFASNAQGGDILYVNPPCLPDDILYVRETSRVGAWDIRNQMIAFDYKDGTCGELVYIHSRDLFNRLVDQSREDARREKCEYNGTDFVWKKGKSPCRWHPSIHMPKEAARIWLRVTDVRVERLQDMTLDDFLNEGVVIRPEAFNDPMNAYLQARNQFIGIWDSTLPSGQQDLYSWEANPWIWAIEFERFRETE